MNQITEKDKEILYHFDINSRRPLRQIAYEINLPENTLRYRVEKLEEKKIVTNYYTLINSYKLGINSLKFYTRFKNINSKIKNDIVSYMIEHEDTWLVCEDEGEFDFTAIFWIRNIHDFYKSWQQVLNRYSKYFLNPILYFQVEAISFKPTYLVNVDKREKNEPFEISKTGSIINIDNIDKKILELLATNARLPTINISSILKLSSNVIKSRIKKLVGKDIIQAYRINFDISKLGYLKIKTDIFLNEYKYQKKIIDYIGGCPYLVCIMKSIGYSHLELEFDVKSLSHFHEIISDLIDNNTDAINNYSYFQILRTHKLRWIPKMID